MVITNTEWPLGYGFGPACEGFIIQASVQDWPIQVLSSQRIPVETAVIGDPLGALVVPLGPHDQRLVLKLFWGFVGEKWMEITAAITENHSIHREMLVISERDRAGRRPCSAGRGRHLVFPTSPQILGWGDASLPSLEGQLCQGVKSWDVGGWECYGPCVSRSQCWGRSWCCCGCCEQVKARCWVDCGFKQG